MSESCFRVWQTCFHHHGSRSSRQGRSSPTVIQLVEVKVADRREFEEVYSRRPRQPTRAAQAEARGSHRIAAQRSARDRSRAGAGDGNNGVAVTEMAGVSRSRGNFGSFNFNRHNNARCQKKCVKHIGSANVGPTESVCAATRTPGQMRRSIAFASLCDRSYPLQKS